MNAAEQQKQQDLQDALIAEIERCRDWIQAALDVGGNTHNVEHIYQGIVENNYQLWSHTDGCVITEIVNYPNCRNLHIWLCGGELQPIMDMLPDIEKFAKWLGAAQITSCGRHGWLKMLEPEGYTRGLLSVNKTLYTDQ